MESRFGPLTIEGFRAFRHFRVESLGRVNLITGRNNTGKSSLLEAIRVLASGASQAVVSDILRSREEGLAESDEADRLSSPEEPFQLSSLFHGFPEFSSELKPIAIVLEGLAPRELSVEAGLLAQEADGTWRLTTDARDRIGWELSEALVVRVDGKQRVHSLDFPRAASLGPRRSAPDADRPLVPCVFLGPYAGEPTATLGPLWDKIALSPREADVLDALRIIDPSISGVSMIGGEGRRQGRKAIVRSARAVRPIPLRSFGDGMNRLFGIVLSLANAAGGILLIDEFENGLHHTIQVDVWRAIFRLATRLDVLVLATSHSWDSVVSFQEAAGEYPEEALLVRLTRKGEQIIPTLFRQGELAIAARDSIEVR